MLSPVPALILVTVAAVAADPAVPRVDKCCPEGQSLSEPSSSAVCLPHHSQSPDYASPPEILPANALWSYSKPPCVATQSELVRFDDGVWMWSFLASGAIVLDPGPDNITYPSGAYCIDYSGDGVNPIPVARVCPCSIVTCVRKCCPVGYLLTMFSADNGSCTRVHDESDEWHPNFAVPGTPYYVLEEFPSCLKTGHYLLNTNPEDSSNYVLLKDGTAQMSNSQLIASDDYCSEKTVIDGRTMDNLMLCLKTSGGRELVHGAIYSALLVTGSVFLLLTLAVQYSLPELRRTVHSRNLTSQTFALLIGYVILSIQSFGYVPSNHIVCATTGYLTQFAFLAAFFWLNVMCIDITWTFSGFRIPEGNSLCEIEGKKFTYYSIYVWGSSLIIVFITLITDSLTRGSSIAPDLGTQKCWFKGKLATLVFFYLPISLILMSNVFLFIYTSYKIIRVRRDTVNMLREDGMRPSCSNFQRFSEFRFTLYLKLSLLMGVTWIFEVIAWAVDDTEKYYYLFVLTDGLNALRGVFVFFLFCRKRRLVEAIRSKFTGFSSVGDKLKRKRTKNSSSKSFPGDSSALYTSHQTQQTQAE